MAKRLVKIAKELNVGTATIVEHLNNNGFEIDNKPTAKVTDEMYEELIKEFQNSMEVKERADQLVIGSRIGSKEAEEEKVPTAATPTPAPPPPAPPADPPAQQKEEKVEPKKEDTTVDKRVELDKTLKVLGKIDLESTKPKKSKPKEEVKPVEPPKEEIAEEPVVEKEEPKETKPTVQKPAAETPTEEVVRAETPQLKGLKILGKIDADKLKKPKKKEEPKEAKPAAKKTSSNEPKKKRRRRTVTSQRVVKDQTARRDRSNRRNKDAEVKEVSQKEIDDKIKATMARLSGGQGKKRQKIRRDKRDTIREKKEAQESLTDEKVLQLTEFVTVQELANLMDVSVSEVITTCMNLGVIVSINQRLDAEVIELVADEFEYEVNFVTVEESGDQDEEEEDAPEELEERAPIVTVMGHVDHGKTSLLDYIRSANVVDGEAGGITQHIGAYEVQVGDDKKKITFLDTPGHEAFTAMRARGAKVTDLAVIIAAADDDIMPQTKEAISHAQAADVPIIFAINKIDKPDAQPEKIKQQLASMNLLVEEWGGEYQSQDISAKTGQNIDELLEKILLMAELLELKANPTRNAVGTVIEASLDKGRGYVTKILVQNGTLKIGDPVVAGDCSGKIKAMFNERGKRLKVAGPATPVLALGLNGAPQAGEKFKVMDSEQEARQVATKRAQISREQTNRATKRISLDEIGRRLSLGTFKELNLIVKGDVDGSVEALSDSLIKLSQETVGVNVIHKGVGQIIESDVLLASASDAIVLGFQVRPSLMARKLAETEGVQIKTYSIIYEAIEEIKMAIEGMLEPDKEEKVTGQLEVKNVFKISKIGTVAGCLVQEGKISRNSNIRLIRDGIVVYPTKEGVVGEVDSLKRFKEDVKEVKNGFECGMSIKNFNDIKVGDIIEVFEVIEIKQTIST